MAGNRTLGCLSIFLFVALCASLFVNFVLIAAGVQRLAVHFVPAKSGQHHLVFVTTLDHPKRFLHIGSMLETRTFDKIRVKSSR